MLKMGMAMSCFEPLAGLFGVVPLRITQSLTRRQSTTAFQTVKPREVATTQTLKRLENVKNMRDFAEACGSIQPGRVFRSACPNSASEADIKLLREELNINHLVDLRSAVERREDEDCLLLKDAEIITSRAFGRIAERETFRQHSEDAVSSTSEKPPSEDGLPNVPALTAHHIALLERNRYLKSLLTRLPRGLAATTIFWSLIDLKRAKANVLSEVNRGGLSQLYEILLDSASKELCTVLKIITRAAEQGSATLIYCRIGKDRTGVASALLLAACDASEDEIISDYARSNGQEGVALGGLDKELEGLDLSAFEAAPPEAMASCLRYLKLAYGGPLQYLDHIGFGEDDRARLKAALSGDRSLPGEAQLNAALRL